MTLRYIGLTVFLLWSFNAFSQEEYPADHIAAQLRSRASAVVRKMETTVDMRANDNMIIHVKRVITVLSKNGDSHGEIALFYNKNTALKYARGVILDASGKAISKFTLSNFSDHSAVSDISLFQDDRVKHFKPAVLSYPYTVVCEYEIRSRQNLVIPDWYANRTPDVAVEYNTYTFICKPEDKVRIRSFNYDGEPVATNDEKYKSQTWTVKNVPAFKTEPYAPNPDDYRTYVKIAPEEFNYYGHKGKYQNWEELGKWIYTDLVKDRQMLSPAAIEEVKNLVTGISNDKDKARKIYEYVQKKTRYISVQIGIGGNQPMQANEVHQLSYGDCKALVNYTQSLLKAVNVPSWYCVVNAGSFKKNMEPEFASMDQGNHIILCLPFKNDTTWLECTSQTSPFGFLGDFTDDRTVLACTEAGGKIIRTPALSVQMNLSDRKAELILDKEGNIIGTMTTTFGGAQYNNYVELVDQPLKEQLKLLKAEYDIDNINFDTFKLDQDKGPVPITKEALQLSIQKYAARTDNRIYLVLNAFNKKSSIPEVRTRTLPVFINRGYTDTDEIVYTLPDDITIEYTPQNVAIENVFGSYHVRIKKEDNKLIYRRKFVLNDGTYPAGKYAEFVDFISTVNTSDQLKAIFKTNSAKD